MYGPVSRGEILVLLLEAPSVTSNAASQGKAHVLLQEVPGATVRCGVTGEGPWYCSRR